jgi:hypothetical protein
MGSVVKAVGGAVGNIVGGVTGQGGKKRTSVAQDSRSFTETAPASKGELGAGRLVDQGLGQLGAFAQGELAGADKEADAVNNIFRNLLINTMQSQGFANPEQIAKATEYVDATFTNPARQQFQRGIEDFQGAQDARAAALGRQVNDTGFNVDTAAQFQRGLGDIELQRGALLQQKADELAFQRPMQQAQLGLQGSAFFNDRAQRAFQNRVGVLDMASQRQNQLFDQRLRSGTQVGTTNQTTTQQNKAGLGSRIAGIASGVVGLGQGIGGALGVDYGNK